jgi:hypothetical protein
MIKLEISSGSIHFDRLTRQTACLTSKSEIEGIFEKSKKVKRALSGMTTEERELEIKEK